MYERSYDCRCLFPQHPGQQHGFIPVPKQEVGEMYQYQPLVLTQLGPDVPNDECLLTNKYDILFFTFVLISVNKLSHTLYSVCSILVFHRLPIDVAALMYECTNVNKCNSMARVILNQKVKFLKYMYVNRTCTFSPVNVLICFVKCTLLVKLS